MSTLLRRRARESDSLRSHEYHMVITDMRMESDESGHEVIEAARHAPYHPAVALLTAFPVEEDDWEEMGADKLLVKPMHTRVLLQQIEQLFAAHERQLAGLAAGTLDAIEIACAEETRKEGSEEDREACEESCGDFSFG